MDNCVKSGSSLYLDRSPEQEGRGSTRFSSGSASLGAAETISADKRGLAVPHPSFSLFPSVAGWFPHCDSRWLPRVKKISRRPYIEPLPDRGVRCISHFTGLQSFGCTRTVWAYIIFHERVSPLLFLLRGILKLGILCYKTSQFQ